MRMRLVRHQIGHSGTSARTGCGRRAGSRYQQALAWRTVGRTDAHGSAAQGEVGIPRSSADMLGAWVVFEDEADLSFTPPITRAWSHRGVTLSGAVMALVVTSPATTPNYCYDMRAPGTCTDKSCTRSTRPSTRQLRPG